MVFIEMNEVEIEVCNVVVCEEINRKKLTRPLNLSFFKRPLYTD